MSRVRLMAAYATPSARNSSDSLPRVMLAKKVEDAVLARWRSWLKISKLTVVSTTSTSRNQRWEISSQTRVLYFS